MFHIIHKWSKWQIIDSGDIVTRDGYMTGKYYYQKRTCEKCGVVQIKRKRTC